MRWIFITAFCAILFGVHVCAVIVLTRRKQLFNKKFIRLLLYLSISDACMLVEYIWHISVVNLKGTDLRNEFQYQCIFLKYLLGGTIVFSALQMFLICLERLKSTFVVPHKILRMLTGNRCVLVSLAVTHGVALTLAIEAIVSGKKPGDPYGCSPEFSLQGHFLLTFDVPVIVFVVAIMICYGYTMVRVVRQRNKVHIANSEASRTTQSGISKVTRTTPRGKSEVTRTTPRGKSEVTRTTPSGNSEVTQMTQSGNSEVTRTTQSGNSEVTRTTQSVKSEVTRTTQGGNLEVNLTTPSGISEVTQTTQSGNSEQIRTTQRSNAIIRMKRNMITLTAIILVNFLAILPRSIYGLYLHVTGFSDITLDVIRVTNNFLLLNVLVDPFIYIFRIQKFRTTLFDIICRNRRRRGNILHVATVQNQHNFNASFTPRNRAYVSGTSETGV